MSHLIIGGTGTVGGTIARDLLAKGETVRILTRSADKAKALHAGATGVVGDLTDPATYDAIFPGTKTLVLVNAVAATDELGSSGKLGGLRAKSPPWSLMRNASAW